MAVLPLLWGGGNAPGAMLVDQEGSTEVDHLLQQQAVGEQFGSPPHPPHPKMECSMAWQGQQTLHLAPGQRPGCVHHGLDDSQGGLQ